jgi:hypothetical protein
VSFPAHRARPQREDRILATMTSTNARGISDRQARALIVAAEECGFERESDLYERQYDATLHEDALAAMENLFACDPEILLAARSAADPICAKTAARRIVQGGRVTAADAQVLLQAAQHRGFAPADPELPLGCYGELFQKAEDAVAFFWTEDPDALVELVGPALRLAPLPESARRLGHDIDAYR